MIRIESLGVIAALTAQLLFLTSCVHRRADAPPNRRIIGKYALVAFSAAALLTSPTHSLLRSVALADPYGTSVESQQSLASATTLDDALVLRAVIEHTILPAVRRASPRTSSAVVVLIGDRSIPICRNNTGRDTPCRFPDHWQRFLVPNPAGNWSGLIDNDRRRRELVESIEARNTLPRVLPIIEHAAVVLVPADRRDEVQQQYREQTVGFSSLSLPGYSRDGYALMYGSYTCGNLCGYGWLFVLEKLDGQWRVQSATVTAIS